MKITQRSKGYAALAVGVALMLAAPVRSNAMFFDIVFDPSAYATLGHIWSEDISTGMKIVQEYNQLVKIYATATSEYALARQLAQRIQQKQFWISVATHASNEVTQNRYGETVNWSAAMNGDYAHVGGAYTNATVRLSPNVDLSRETLGTSAALANLASVESMDSANQACLQAAAQYRANQQANAQASNTLNASVVDAGDGTNSTVGQLNQLNGGAAQLRAEAQSAGTLNACLVEQQALANTIQRNTQVEAFNTYAQAQQIRASNPTNLSSVSTAATAELR